jgi:hypothetical protein
MKTKKIIPWLYQDKPVLTIDDMPSNVYGFVYYVEFEDGSKYIGKKQLYSILSMKPKKDGTFREGTIMREYRNTGKGFRTPVDIVKKESNWKVYQGSAKKCKDKIVSYREILEYCYTALELTYAEVRMLFKYDILGDESYINDNISGTFYRTALDDYYRRKNTKESN